MAFQIANPRVIQKIEALARKTGLTRTASVEKAGGPLAGRTAFGGPGPCVGDRFDAILAQIDRVPDVASPVDPLEWDEFGLPRPLAG